MDTPSVKTGQELYVIMQGIHLVHHTMINYKSPPTLNTKKTTHKNDQQQTSRQNVLDARQFKSCEMWVGARVMSHGGR